MATHHLHQPFPHTTSPRASKHFHAADDGTTLKAMLLQLTAAHPGIADYVRRTYSSYLAREQARVVDFDHHSKSI